MADKVLDTDNFEIQRTKINQQVDEKGQLTDTVDNSGRLKITQGPAQQNLTPVSSANIVSNELQFSDDGNLIILDENNTNPGDVINAIQTKGYGHVITIRCEGALEGVQMVPAYGTTIIADPRYGTDGPSGSYFNLVPGMEFSFIEIETPYDNSHKYHLVGTNCPEKFKASIIDSTISTSSLELTVDDKYNVYNVTITGDTTLTSIVISGGGGGQFIQRGYTVAFTLTPTSLPMKVQNSANIQLPENKDLTVNAHDTLVFICLDEDGGVFRLIGRSAVQIPAKKVVYVQDADPQTPKLYTYFPVYVDNPTIVYNYKNSFVQGLGGIRIPSGVTKARFGATVKAAGTVPTDSSAMYLSLVQNYDFMQNEDFGTLVGGGNECVVGYISSVYQARGVVWYNNTGTDFNFRLVHFHIDSIVGSLAAISNLNVYVLITINDDFTGYGYEPWSGVVAQGSLPLSKITPGFHTVELNTVVTVPASGITNKIGIVFDFDVDPGVGNYLYLTAGRAQDLTSWPPTASPLGHWLGNSNANSGGVVQHVRQGVHGGASNTASWKTSIDGINSDYPVWLSLQNDTFNLNMMYEAQTGSDDIWPFSQEVVLKSPTLLVSEGDVYSLGFHCDSVVADGLDVQEFWMEVVE